MLAPRERLYMLRVAASSPPAAVAAGGTPRGVVAWLLVLFPAGRAWRMLQCFILVLASYVLCCERLPRPRHPHSNILSSPHPALHRSPGPEKTAKDVNGTECGSCYGAQTSESQCCNTCAEVRQRGGRLGAGASRGGWVPP